MAHIIACFQRDSKGVGLHYTALATAICVDSRPTAASRGVSRRKKFADKANVESRDKAAALDLNMLLGMLAGASVVVPFLIGDDDEYRHAIESKSGSSPENPLRMKPVTMELQGRRWILAYSDEEWMQKTEAFKLPHRVMPFVECIGIADTLLERSNGEPIGIALDMYTDSACALTPEMLNLCKQLQ